MDELYDSHWLVLAQFNELQLRLCSFMKSVPYINRNIGVLSPALPSLLVESCNLIESIFKQYFGDSKVRGGLKGYVNIVEPRMNLDESTSILLVSPLQFLCPFKGWITKVPPWWSAYNNLKHDRMNHFESASYENVLMAIAGLHQVIVRSRMFVSPMVREGWINNEGVFDIANGREEGCLPANLHAETHLFVTTMIGDLWEDSEDGCQRINPFWDFSSRVKSLIYEQEYLGFGFVTK